MKLHVLSIVVGLGLVVGLWWTREAPVSRPAADQVADPPSRARRAIRPSNAATSPVVAPPMVELAKQERPTLEPTAADPKRRKAQEALWQELRRFASRAELTDAQWDQFERDLSELAESEATAWANAVRTGDFDGALDELNDELAHDLQARCAAYMTQKQLSVLRFFRPDALISRVRALHFIEFQNRLLTPK